MQALLYKEQLYLQNSCTQQLQHISDIPAQTREKAAVQKQMWILANDLAGSQEKQVLGSQALQPGKREQDQHSLLPHSCFSPHFNPHPNWIFPSCQSQALIFPSYCMFSCKLKHPIRANKSFMIKRDIFKSSQHIM